MCTTVGRDRLQFFERAGKSHSGTSVAVCTTFGQPRTGTRALSHAVTSACIDSKSQKDYRWALSVMKYASSGCDMRARLSSHHVYHGALHGHKDSYENYSDSSYLASNDIHLCFDCDDFHSNRLEQHHHDLFLEDHRVLNHGIYLDCSGSCTCSSTFGGLLRQSLPLHSHTALVSCRAD